ncbi:MobF family relaxase [Nonomuraea sp. NPDC003707]
MTLDPETSAKITRYRPRVPPPEWEQVADTVRMLVAASADRCPYNVERLLHATTRLATWCHRRGLPDDPEVWLRHETIDAFVLAGCTDLAPSSAQTYRSWLRHMRASVAWLERGEQAPPPMKAPKSVSPPYSPAQLVGNRGYDLTLDLPKSVSVLYGLADDELARGIEDAFAQAVYDTVAAVEVWAGYGIRSEKGEGKTGTRVEGTGLSGWIMWHSSARPVQGQVGDQHLHAHVMFANMVRAVDGTWGVFGDGGRDLLRHDKAAGTLVQARPRRLLSECYGIAWRRDEHTGAWEIAGVGAELRTLFSKRGGQAAAELLAKLGLADAAAASTAQRKAAGAKTREAKDSVTNVAQGSSPAGPVDARTSWRAQACARRCRGGTADCLLRGRRPRAAAAAQPEGDRRVDLAAGRQADRPHQNRVPGRRARRSDGRAAGRRCGLSRRADRAGAAARSGVAAGHPGRRRHLVQRRALHLHRRHRRRTAGAGGRACRVRRGPGAGG